MAYVAATGEAGGGAAPEGAKDEFRRGEGGPAGPR